MSNLRQAITRTSICMLLPQVLFVGCTVVGAVIGSSLSSDSPTNFSFLKSGAVTLGTKLLVIKKDSTEVRGRFVGVLTADEASFTERYLVAAGDLKYIRVLPLPGDSLVFTYGVTDGRLIGRGRFRSLVPGTLVLSRAISPQHSGVLPLPGDSLVFTYAVKGGRLIGRGRYSGLKGSDLVLSQAMSPPNTATRIPIDSLGSLHVEGRGDADLASIRSLILWESTVITQPDSSERIAIEHIGSLYIEGRGVVSLSSIRRLILRESEATTRLVLNCDADTVLVPLADIGSVTVEGAHYAWPIGIGVGAAVDITLIVAGMRSLSSGSGGSCDGGSVSIF
jgi:hypothetical protein